MQSPLRITFRNIPHSDAIAAHAEERAAKLDTFSDRIIGCHVAIEAPHVHQHSGRHYRVRIDLTVPGGEVVVSHAADDDRANEDLYAAIDQAFDRAGRRLEDYVRRQRGDVKPHDDPYRHGRVSKLAEHEGYGFITTADGDEVYFHRNSVLHGGFVRLKVGAAVRFVEEIGQKGPQASTVTPVGRSDAPHLGAREGTS